MILARIREKKHTHLFHLKINFFKTFRSLHGHVNGDGGLVVRLMTRDRGVPGSNPARTVGFF